MTTLLDKKQSVIGKVQDLDEATPDQVPAPKEPATRSQIERACTISGYSNHQRHGRQDHKRRRETVMPKALLVEPFAARMRSMSATGMMASTSRMRPTALGALHFTNASTANPDTMSRTP